jgi:hypothetical protein
MREAMAVKESSSEHSLARAGVRVVVEAVLMLSEEEPGGCERGVYGAGGG